jgi:hypothetical protein
MGGKASALERAAMRFDENRFVGARHERLMKGKSRPGRIERVAGAAIMLHENDFAVRRAGSPEQAGDTRNHRRATVRLHAGISEHAALNINNEEGIHAETLAARRLK